MSFFKTTYSDLANQVKEASAYYTDEKVKINERFVKCLWMEQPFKDSLFTTDGSPVKIVFPGWWNLESGPDFKKALISFNGQKPIQGDVEVHTFAKDWQRHGHAKNPGFDNTILHAFLKENRKKPLKISGKSIPQFEIIGFLNSDLNKLTKQIDMTTYPYHTPLNLGDCHTAACQSGIKGALKALGSAGDTRILKKVGKLDSASDKESWDQLLYEKIMEALGYKTNSEAFLSLAKRVPLAEINKILSVTPSPKKRSTITAILLGASGLLTESPDEMDSCSMKNIRDWKKIWQNNSPLAQGKADIKWSKRACRPANYPHRRIAGMSGFIVNMSDANWLEHFRQLLESFYYPGQWKDLFIALKLHFNCQDPYWSFRYSYSGKQFSNPINLIGEQRLKTILVNAILPVMVRYSRHTYSSDLEKSLHSLFSCMPMAEPNTVTRFMERTLLGKNILFTGEQLSEPGEQRLSAGMKSEKIGARLEQGLVQVYKDYCATNPEGCIGCEFPLLLTKLAEK